MWVTPNRAKNVLYALHVPASSLNWVVVSIIDFYALLPNEWVEEEAKPVERRSHHRHDAKKSIFHSATRLLHTLKQRSLDALHPFFRPMMMLAAFETCIMQSVRPKCIVFALPAERRFEVRLCECARFCDIIENLLREFRVIFCTTRNKSRILSAKQICWHWQSQSVASQKRFFLFLL